MKKVIALLLSFVLILSLAACAAKPAATKPAETAKVEFTFVVVDKDGKETNFTISTDKKIVGEALQDEGLIAGEMGDYGLYVKTVNGQTLDYDTDGMYWSFYVNGEYGMTGVDQTEIVPGTTYMFKAESA